MAVSMETKTYQAFRGVDFSTSPACVSDDRASDMLNMYVGDDGIMQKRPGWHTLSRFTDALGGSVPINGIHYLALENGQKVLFIHAGVNLYWTLLQKPLRNFANNSYGDVPREDVDDDSTLTADASYILRYLKGIQRAEPWQVRNMDVDGDGRVTEDDADLLLRYQVGLLPIPTADINANATYNIVADAVLNNERSFSFEHEGKLYLLDGSKYYVITPTFTQSQVTVDTRGVTTIGYITSFTASVVEGYTPTTSVHGYYKYDELNEEGTNTPGSQANPGVWVKPVPNEKRNLLQTKQINTFCADGIHKAFYLDQNNNDIVSVERLLKTRCKAVDGVDVPTQENIDHVDAGTYNGIYYYYKKIWTIVDPSTYTIRQSTSETPEQNTYAYATRIMFNSVPDVDNDGAGTENIRVTFIPRKHSSTWATTKDRGYIDKCTFATKFGYFNRNRFFLSGNPDHRHWDFASEIDDPTYFPYDCWTAIGSQETAIMGYLHYGTELAIVKEDNEQDATIYMRSAILTEDNDVLFPVQQGAQGVGGVSRYAFGVLRDDPLFLAKEGLFAVEGTDASQERNTPNRSFFVDTKLKNDITPDMVAVSWGNYFLLCSPSTGRCYVADARSGENRNGSFVYDWYLWDNVPAKVFCVIGDTLFFGTQDGRLCQFNHDWTEPIRFSDGAEYVTGSTKLYKWKPYGGGDPIHAYYVTKRDHLGALDFKKTILNDGGVITLYPQALSSASISVKTERGEWFVDHIQTDSDEPSIVIPIKKRVKNFDSIQTRVENNEINEGIAVLGIQYRYAITTNRREYGNR